MHVPSTIVLRWRCCGGAEAGTTVRASLFAFGKSFALAFVSIVIVVSVAVDSGGAEVELSLLGAEAGAIARAGLGLASGNASAGFRTLGIPDGIAFNIVPTEPSSLPEELGAVTTLVSAAKAAAGT